MSHIPVNAIKFSLGLIKTCNNLTKRGRKIKWLFVFKLIEKKKVISKLILTDDGTNLLK